MLPIGLTSNLRGALSAALPLALACLLAACGESGSGAIASAPPPAVAPAPTPTATPAPAPAAVTPRLTSVTVEKVAPLSARAGLTDGTFAVKAITESGDVRFYAGAQIQPAGAVRLAIDKSGPSYTLLINVPGFPAQQSFDFSVPMQFDGPQPGNDAGFGYHIVRTEHYSDGSSVVSEEDKTSGLCCPPYRENLTGGQWRERSFSLYLQSRYLTLGWWRDEILEPDPAGPVGSERLVTGRRLEFVQGIRTAPADIPVAGTATYQGGPFDLLADFAARTMAADYALTFADEDGQIYERVAATGKAPITASGDFLIPMSGTFANASNVRTDVLSGSIDGALFGPQGAEAGGVYVLMRGSGVFQSGIFAATKGP